MGSGPRPAVSHFAGAAQIVKARGFSGPKDEFERMLLLTLRGPVVRHIPIGKTCIRR